MQSFLVLLRLLNFGRELAFGKRHQDSQTVFFTFFFHYSVLQYTNLLPYKLISFCVTLVNLLSSHTDSHWRLLLQLQNSDATLLHTVYILLVCSTFSSLLSPKLAPNNTMLIYSLLIDMGGHACWLTLGD